MATKFFVQRERNKYVSGNEPTLSVEAASVVETISEQKWLHPECDIQCSFGSMDGLLDRTFPKAYLQQVVPIGTIEFVEEVMRQAYDSQGIKPQTIPDSIRTEELLRRRVITVDSILVNVKFCPRSCCLSLSPPPPAGEKGKGFVFLRISQRLSLTWKTGGPTKCF